MISPLFIGGYLGEGRKVVLTERKMSLSCCSFCATIYIIGRISTLGIHNLWEKRASSELYYFVI